MSKAWNDTLDLREQQEIEFAQVYLEEFNHGTPGHLHYSLIAKLAEMLAVASEDELPIPPTNEYVLSVPYHSQHEVDAKLTRKDCGAACVEMIGEYLTGKNATTDDIMKWMTGGADRATYISELQRAAKHFYGIELTRHNDATWEQLKDWVTGDMTPVIVLGRYGAFLTRMDRNYTGGHFFVIVGFDIIDYQGTTIERAILHDPDFYRSSVDLTPQGAFIPVIRLHFEYIWSTCHLNGNPNNLALVPPSVFDVSEEIEL